MIRRKFKTVFCGLLSFSELFLERITSRLRPVWLGVIITVFGVAGVVQAGSLSPSGSPAATFYTLGDIYTRLTTNATATEGDHDFAPAADPAGSLYTLTQIYDSIPTIVASTVKLGTSYLGVDGTLTPDGGTAAVGDLFNRKTAHLTSDWALDTGTLDLACNTSTFDGIANLVADTYDGAGDGTNRFCMTDSGDATAADLLSGKTVWVDGVAVAGSMTDREGDNASTAQAASGGVNYLTAPSGFYDGDDRVSATDAEVAALDADLTAANIVSGNTIFGVAGSASSGYKYGDEDQSFVLGTATGAGTALVDLFNGSDTGESFPGGSQGSGGVDDYNNGGDPAVGRYEGGWTACNSENTYCGTGLSSADAKDDSTGLVWSLPCNGSGCSSFSDSSPLTYTWDNSGGNNNSQTASELCSAGSHGEDGWSLPHQKQLLQAYIDGSYGNLETSGANRGYWSATTYSYLTSNAWYTSLSNGITYYYGKNLSNYVRCVRPAS
jgi:hypothetical protein